MTRLMHCSNSTALGVRSQTGYLCRPAVIENPTALGTNIATEVVVRRAQKSRAPALVLRRDLG